MHVDGHHRKRGAKLNKTKKTNGEKVAGQKKKSKKNFEGFNLHSQQQTRTKENGIYNDLRLPRISSRF